MDLVLLQRKTQSPILGSVKKKILKAFDVKSEVLYAEFDWDTILELCKASKTTYQTVPKFPAVRRDLALLVDTSVEFNTLQSLAKQYENQLRNQSIYLMFTRVINFLKARNLML